jgi:hypothetical protein
VTIDELEVPPIARVKRSRLAFAVAVSIAALPVIVLDNLPSTAEANEAQVETDGRDLASSSSSERSTTTIAPTTTSTEAPTTTTAAAETTTSEASTTSESVEVQTFAAPPPTEPPTTAAPTTTAPPAPRYGDPDDPATWDRLAECESGGNWAMNSGNGYYGGLQFSLATWQSVGGTGYPHQASRNEQIHRAQILQSRAGWGQWPACSAELGYT